MLLSKIKLTDIESILSPNCELNNVTVNQLTKLNGHKEPILLLATKSNGEHLLIHELEEFIFKYDTGLIVDATNSFSPIKSNNNELITKLHEENKRNIEEIHELKKLLEDKLNIEQKFEEKAQSLMIKNANDMKNFHEFYSNKIEQLILSHKSELNNLVLEHKAVIQKHEQKLEQIEKRLTNLIENRTVLVTD
ncbi:unnamed protein product [Didymodactylos carnosus]|uniref:Uncharacterized protein n=1 Tax=Didymodactylos carnosus TaxID=1234261 RepID=A0A8S2ECW8_9BILA|nr:unnamed protein product [Didymodactylos carnosus]CAF4001341.1 unnamed protein product [Didymodactylos carnosus]